MKSPLAKLVQIGSPALLAGPPVLAGDLAVHPGAAALRALLVRKNGFYGFESALHVLPAGRGEGVMDLATWNAPGLWRDAYGPLADGYLFFAEDVFGVQFAFRGAEVVTFDPETGEAEALARDLAAWAQAILEDYNYLTGHELAHEWQRRHGPLKAGERLLPKIPFVMGGPFALDNLYALDAVKGMRFRGDMAKKIHDLPDGSQVKLGTTD
ncbi:MAG TPA: SMI1/KNR4 family protein [Thermoanaerobaculia bacterium]|jgi:hypothetical protein|nr:SMI1/KNR4 family protein [Thermoanaerobaculia bacterium]